MSVLIRDMKMPDNCLECQIRSYDEEYGAVCPFSKIPCLNIDRQSDCPLIEVDFKFTPEPRHGNNMAM